MAGLFDRFFGQTVFDPNFSSHLIQLGRDAAQSWSLRRIAALMLEYVALRMWQEVGFGEESCRLLAELGLIVNGRVRESVLADGYTTTEPLCFAVELRTRLARLDRVHRRMNGWATTPEALRDFVHVGGVDCKLTLARYLFQPEEIARRVLDQVRTTPGLAPANAQHMPPKAASRSAAFEEILIDSLRRDRKILWVSPATPAEMNSLVECPLGTVALVIKPPGSDREFEIKRTGLRGPRVVDVLFERDGVAVPLYHRMQGTSTGSMLAFEDSAIRHFASFYRAVHGIDPPASRMLGYTPITTIPTGQGDVQILDYLSNPGAYGGDFARMRDHLKRSVVAFEGTQPRQDLPGEFGWTMRFFNRVVPNQAWIEGTSAFRLDRIAQLLSADGPDSYFRSGLGREFTLGDERRLADEVLEEVLGVVHPPVNGWSGFSAYVESTLEIPANRAAADAAYLDAIDETGRYWGTLLGTGGFSEGESFVTRNVGVKSRWQAGSWRPRICFMDHDNLNVPSESVPDLARTVGGMRGDDLWVCGDADRSIMMCLKRIYRPTRVMQTRGEDLLRASLQQAFRATRSAMRNSSAVRGLFRDGYLQSLERRDEVIRLYLKTSHSETTLARWRKKATRILSETVYDQNSVPTFLDFIVRFEALLRKYSFVVEEPAGHSPRQRDKPSKLG